MTLEGADEEGLLRDPEEPEEDEQPPRRPTERCPVCNEPLDNPSRDPKLYGVVIHPDGAQTHGGLCASLWGLDLLRGQP